MDGEHHVGIAAIGSAVGTDNFCTFAPNDIWILSVAGTVNHESILDASLTQTLNGIDITCLPNIFTVRPFRHPLVADVYNYV